MAKDKDNVVIIASILGKGWPDPEPVAIRLEHESINQLLLDDLIACIRRYIPAAKITLCRSRENNLVDLGDADTLHKFIE